MHDIEEQILSEPLTVVKKEKVFNPYPGLRPFSIQENFLFFGREGQSEEVIRNLTTYRFAAITGASGGGKSSLIYCGVIPALHGGFIPGAGSNWRIVSFRPGNDPFQNMAHAIYNTEKKFRKPEDDVYKAIIHSVLRRSNDGLIEVIKQLKVPQNENILLLVDQFEELFRFREATKNVDEINETEGFIKLLVEAVNQTEVPIYVVITMRSDFMGDCSNFLELSKKINESNFLIPQMSREDYRKAIKGPIAVAGAAIEEQLVNELLNSVQDESDTLSVVQHALMRTYDHWIRYSDPNAPISYVDYEAAGKVENALSLHANEAYNELSDDGKRICRSMFTTLTERGEDNRGIRHPAKVSTIAEIAQASVKDTMEVIEKFRSKGRAFLTPSSDTDLTAETVIDISHESIMRIWDKLRIWVQEESESVQMYLRLAEAAELYQLGKTGLWRPPDLLLALNWKKKYKPNLAWARRYNPAFERTMVFLEASEKRYNAEEKNKVKIQKRALRRSRRLAVSSVIIALVFFSLMFYANVQKREADRQRMMAEENRREADRNARIAEQRALEADKYRQIAERNAMTEQQRRELAETEKSLAERERQIAMQEATEAEEQSEKLLQDNTEIREEKETIERTLQVTEQEKTQAQKEKEAALQQRMLTIARTMSVKSTQVDRNRDLQGLLAYQAYLFNRDYNGTEHNQDIYTALYSALKEFNYDLYEGFNGHSGAIRSLAFTPRSNVFYSAGGDGKILKWSLDGNNRRPTTIINNNSINWVLEVSPNGRWLACGTGDSDIQLFDVNSINQGPITLKGHAGWVLSLSFSSDERKLFSSSRDKSVMVWDLSSFSGTKIIQNDEPVRVIEVSPSGNKIAGGTDDGRVMTWNLDGSAANTIYTGNGNTIYTLSYNNRGNLIAIGDKGGSLKLINASGGSIQRNFSGHKARILDVDFSPNGKFLGSSSYDGTVRIWNMDHLEESPIILTGHESWVLDIAFSPDSRHLITSSQRDDVIMVWPTETRFMADEMCTYLSRNFTQSEWAIYVAPDISYQQTCKK